MFEGTVTEQFVVQHSSIWRPWGRLVTFWSRAFSVAKALSLKASQGAGSGMLRGSLNFAMKCGKWESIDKTWQDLHLLFWGEDLYCHELSEDRVYKCIHVHTMICAKPPSLNKHQTAAQCALDSWSQDESGIEVARSCFPAMFQGWAKMPCRKCPATIESWYCTSFPAIIVVTESLPCCYQ